jgi:hypothetical protein
MKSCIQNFIADWLETQTKIKQIAAARAVFKQLSHATGAGVLLADSGPLKYSVRTHKKIGRPSLLGSNHPETSHA